jgi:peptidoglycan hydrolase CwlO-like protein
MEYIKNMLSERKKTAREKTASFFLRARKALTAKKAGLVFLAVVFAVLDFGFISSRAAAYKQTHVIQDTINKTASQLKQTQAQLQQSQVQYQVNQHQIVSTKVVLTQTQQDIIAKEKEIDDLNQQIENNKILLAGYIQEMSINDQTDPLVSFASSGDSLNALVGNYDQMINVKGKILDMVSQINQQEGDLSGVKSQLAGKVAQNEQYLAAKQVQQTQVVNTIQTAQATIAQLNAKLSALQSQLAALLGSGVSAKDIMDAAKIASKATGVDKDFIIGELVVESDMGKFTGGCTYSQSKMGSTNASIFKNICSNLGLNYKTQKVSCPLSYGIGGAMGVAQFMPSTWVGYASQISAATGNNPPNPWSLADGVTGMAIMLAHDGATSKHGESDAAARYYCGGNIGRAVCQNYADKVMYWADNYQQLMN